MSYSGSSGQSYPNDWRERRRKQKPAENSYQRALKASFIGLLIIAGVICLILIVNWERGPVVNWYWIPIESPEDPTLPANIAALEDAALLEGVLESKSRSGLAKYESKDLSQNLSGEELLRFVNDLEALGPEAPKEIVVFCSAHGILKDGRPMLVPQRGDNQNCLDLIRRLDRLEHVNHVLLVIDASRCGLHCWKLGNVANGFSGRLVEELSDSEQESLSRVSVLISAGLHEESWLQPDESASVFARVLAEGLLGHADGWTADGADGLVDKVVSTDELCHYTVEHVARWVEKNRGVRQTVRYFPARAEPFHLVSVGSDPPANIAEWRTRIAEAKAEQTEGAAKEKPQKDEDSQTEKDKESVAASNENSGKPSQSEDEADDPAVVVETWLTTLKRVRESVDRGDAGPENRIQMPRAGWLVREANWNARFELMFSKAEMLVTLAAANPGEVNDFRREMIDSHLRKLEEHLQRKEGRYSDLLEGLRIVEGDQLSSRSRQISTLSFPLAAMLRAPAEEKSDESEQTETPDPLEPAYAIEVDFSDEEMKQTAMEAMRDELKTVRDAEIPVTELSASLLNRFEQLLDDALPVEECRNLALILDLLGPQTSRVRADARKQYDELWPVEVLLLKRIVASVTDPSLSELGWTPDSALIKRLFELRKSAEGIIITDSSLPLFRNQFKQMELDLIAAERWLLPPVVGREDQARVHLDRADQDYRRILQSWRRHRDVIHACGDIASSAPGIANYFARRLEADLGAPTVEQAQQLANMASGEAARQLPAEFVLDPQLERLWKELFELWIDANDFAGNDEELFDPNGELKDRWKQIDQRWNQLKQLVEDEMNSHRGRTIADWQARSAALALPTSLRDPQGLTELWGSVPTADSTVAPNDAYGVWDGYLAIAIAKLLQADVSFDPWLQYVEELRSVDDPADISLKKLSALAEEVRNAAAFEATTTPDQSPETTDGFDGWLALKQEIWRRRSLSEAEYEFYHTLADRTDYQALEEEPGLWAHHELPQNSSVIVDGDSLSLEGIEPQGEEYRLSVSQTDDKVRFSGNRTQLRELELGSLSDYQASLTSQSIAMLSLQLTQRKESGTVIPLDVGFLEVQPRFDPNQWRIVIRTLEDNPRELRTRPLPRPDSNPRELSRLKGVILDVPSMNFDEGGRTMSYDDEGHPSDEAPPLPVAIFLTGPPRDDVDRQVELAIKRWDPINDNWSTVTERSLQFPRGQNEILVPPLEGPASPPEGGSPDVSATSTAPAEPKAYDIAHGLLFEIRVGDERIEHLFQPYQKPVEIRKFNTELERSSEGTGHDVRISFSYEQPTGPNPAQPVQFPVKLRLVPDARPAAGLKRKMESIISADEDIELYMNLSDDYFAREEVLRLSVAGYPRVYEFQLKKDIFDSHLINREEFRYENLRLILTPPDSDRVVYLTAGGNPQQQPEDTIEAYVDIDFKELVEPDHFDSLVWETPAGSWRRKELKKWYLVLEYEPIAAGAAKGRLVFPETSRDYERIHWSEPRQIELVPGEDGWGINSRISLRKYRFKLPKGAIDRFELRAYLTDDPNNNNLARMARLYSSPPRKLIIDNRAPPDIEMSGPSGQLKWKGNVNLQITAEDRISGIQRLQLFVDQDGNGMLDAKELASPADTARFDPTDEESREIDWKVRVPFAGLEDLIRKNSDQSIGFLASATNGAGITSAPQAFAVTFAEPPPPPKKTGTLQVSLPVDVLGGEWTIKWEGEESDSVKTKSTSLPVALPAGKYKIMVENRRRKLREAKEVTIKVGQPTPLKLTFSDLPNK